MAKVLVALCQFGEIMFIKTLRYGLFSALLSLLTAVSAGAQELDTLHYFKHVPKAWRSEIIAFPLDFAPTLEYQGRLELLFSPGMFDDKSEEFLSYGFIWGIEGTDIPRLNSLNVILKPIISGFSLL